MTDHKFTDDDVIKGLEGLAAYDCKRCLDLGHDCFEKDCDKVIAENALTLINRQKAEIERLNKCIKTEDEVREIMESQMLPMVREIAVAQINRAKEIGRIEAIKEFAECAKKRFSEKLGSVNESFFSYSVQREIDTLVKEMTEGKND